MNIVRTGDFHLAMTPKKGLYIRIGPLGSPAQYLSTEAAEALLDGLKEVLDDRAR